MSWVNKVLAFVLENANGLLVLVGAGWLYAGIAGFSRHAADVLGGALLLGLGLVPYLLRLRKRKP